MTNNYNIQGPGFFTLLAVLFIGLKLGNVISWSWWWVLCPIWIPICLLLIIIFGLLIAYCISEVFK